MTDLKYYPKHGLWGRPETLDEYIMKEQGGYRHLNLQPHDVVMDAGGNIGAFACWASSQCRSVVSYEPEQENFEILQKNIVTKSNLEAHRKALISTDAPEVSFYVNKLKNKGMHGTAPKRGRLEVKVPAANFFTELERVKPNVLKMDIEGGEFSLLLGNPLPAYVEKLAIEIHLNSKQWRNELAPLLIHQLTNDFRTVKPPKITPGGWATVGFYERRQ